MSDPSDRVLVSLKREAAERIRDWLDDGLPDFRGPSSESLSASLAAPDGIPEGMAESSDRRFAEKMRWNVPHFDLIEASLEGARDFEPEEAS